MEEIERGIATLENWMRPLDRNEILAGLGHLKILTADKTQKQDDVEAQIRLYAAKLAEWPSAVVYYVLKTQPDINDWFPKWKPLQARLEMYSEKNQMALKALIQYRDGNIEPVDKKTKPGIKDLAAVAKTVLDTAAIIRKNVDEMEAEHKREMEQDRAKRSPSVEK